MKRIRSSRRRKLKIIYEKSIASPQPLSTPASLPTTTTWKIRWIIKLKRSNFCKKEYKSKRRKPAMAQTVWAFANQIMWFLMRARNPRCSQNGHRWVSEALCLNCQLKKVASISKLIRCYRTMAKASAKKSTFSCKSATKTELSQWCSDRAKRISKSFSTSIWTKTWT